MNCLHLGPPYALFVRHPWIWLFIFVALYGLYSKGRSHKAEFGDVLAVLSSSEHPTEVHAWDLVVGVRSGWWPAGSGEAFVLLLIS